MRNSDKKVARHPDWQQFLGGSCCQPGALARENIEASQ
jgi:hypothetical protein